jgi:hypothetical protein
MKRAQSSLVVQLRTGKIGFRAFLYKMKVPGIEDPLCNSCEDKEEMTVEHVLMKCQRWTRLREECFGRAFRPETTPTLEGLLGTRKGSLAAARMVWKTGLLAQFRASNLEDMGEASDIEEDEGGDSESTGEGEDDS